MEAAQQRAILFDLTRCSGCGECVEACMLKQGFEGDPSKVKDMSATAYCSLNTVSNPEDSDDEYTYRDLCRHCVEPSCASVCPVGALQKTDLGPVTYDADKCMGCRYCMTACPFDVPRYEWDSAVPTVRKCDMCFDLQSKGEDTACAAACSYGATICGTREELLEEARSRLEEDPDDYYPHIYGEHEVGGTSVLFLSPFPVEELGFDPKLGTEPMPTYTWRVLEKIPGVAITAGATMCALWWLTNRRNEVRDTEAREKLAAKAAQAEKKNGSSHEENGHG